MFQSRAFRKFDGMKNIFYATLIVAVFIVSCKKDEPDVICEPTAVTMELRLTPTLNATNYQLSDVIESPQGYKYFYTDIKIVGTNVGNGTVHFGADYFYDFATKGNVLAVGPGNPTIFNNVSFNVGVPTELNHGDPALPASTSALNISNIGDMYWGWNPGYKFVTIEGKVDTIPDGIDNFNKSFFFHLGTDFLFRTKTLSDVTWNKESDTKYVAELKLHVKDILDGSNPTDLRVYAASHSSNNQMSYSLIIMDQFLEAIKK